MKFVKQCRRITFFICAIHFSYSYQIVNDSTKSIERYQNKSIVKTQINQENDRNLNFFKINQNDLHRPNYKSINGFTFNHLIYEYLNSELNNPLSNLLNYDYINSELNDTIYRKGNKITYKEFQIDNYTPVSNLIIDEGDFLYSYVDAFIRTRINEDVGFSIGIRNIESSASFDNELENPQFKSKLDYKISNDVELTSVYLINSNYYKDIGMTEVTPNDSIYQINNDYFVQRFFDRRFINKLSYKEFDFTYEYVDYEETKKISLLDSNDIHIYKHHFGALYDINNEITFQTKVELNHGHYFKSNASNTVISGRIDYSSDHYTAQFSLDLYNDITENYPKLSPNYNSFFSTKLGKYDISLFYYNKQPSLNILYYNRNHIYSLNNLRYSVLNNPDLAFYGTNININSNILTEKTFGFDIDYELYDIFLKLNFIKNIDLIEFDESKNQFNNKYESTVMGLNLNYNKKFFKYLSFHSDNQINFVNKNSLYPDYKFNIELFSNFTLFTNLKTHLLIGSDIVIDQPILNYLNYIDFFYNPNEKEVTYVQPFARAKFSIIDLDLIFEFRNPFKVHSQQLKGYQSFSYGTTYKLSWTFFD